MSLTFTFIEKPKDVILLQTLLTAGDINLDEISYNGRSSRDSGIIVMVEIVYTNWLPWTGLIRGKPRYSYEVSVLDKVYTYEPNSNISSNFCKRTRTKCSQCIMVRESMPLMIGPI